MAKRKNSTSTEATPSKTTVDATAVTISSNAEESFPRGGASALTPLEHREIANQAAKDLFELKPNKKTKTTAKPAEKPKSDKAYIEQLTFKKLTVGTCLLGCVSRINELELFVSLPHQLVGVIPITEISDALTETIQKIANDEDEDMDEEENKMPSLNNMFYVGQWLRCKITNLPALEEKAKRPIELSLKPQVVNEDLLKIDTTPGVTLGATVKSVEDHGYVLDLGVKDLTGFLPTKEAKSYIEKYNRNEELSVGQYVECLVEKTNKRIANVTIDRSKIANSTIENPFSRITSVLPGQRVSGMIEAVQNNGLVLKMMGLYKVTIDATHIPANIDIETSFKLGQKLVFRTLFTILNTEEKTIGGSILPHVLELDVPVLANGIKSDKFVGDVFPVGSFLDNVKVYRVSSGGIWVTLDSLDGVTGFVHISRLADERVPSLSATAGDYKIGSTHRARVLSYNPVDAILVLTLQPSILAEKYLRVTDIEIGSMVEGVVEKLVPAGVIVKISKSINALVPAVHMADVKLSHPEYKFKSGKKVECRVLKIDPERQRVILTLKKSLINSEYPIFQNLADIHEGDISHGVIMAIKKNGCVVAYYNNISAFVPGSEMTEAHVADLSTVYNVGQTVKTTVLRVDPSANKLIVSCIAHKKKKEKQVTKKEKKEKKEKTEKSEKKPVKKAVKKDNHLRTVAKKNGLKKFSDVRRGVCYQGYITNITDAGVFLKLSKTISARVKIGNLSDEFVENWKSLYKVGDCVQLKIIHIDREQERLEASLKKSVIERKDESKQEGQTAEDSDSDEEMPEVDESEDEDEDEEMKDNNKEEDDDSDDEEEEKPEVDDDDDEEDEEEDDE
ncbi:unnamed protein product [Rhizopus microsporus]